MTGPAARAEGVGPARVLRLWLPTALSTSMLVAEIPVIAALVARGGRGAESLAAFGVVIGVIVLVNAPGIPLASTLAALCTSARAVAALRRHSAALGGGIAVALALVLASPAGEALLDGVFALPGAVAPLARTGLLILSPAPLVVAWRRCHHGVLITMRRTAPIALASGLRIAVSVLTAVAVLTLTGATGVVVGALGLLAGATTEAAVVGVAARGYRRALPGGEPVGRRRALALHLPLAGATLLSALPQPLVAAGIARGLEAQVSLAGWPVVYGLVWLVAGATFDLEAVTTSLRRAAARERATFPVTLGAGCLLSAVLVVAVRTPVGAWYLADFSALPPAVVAASLDAMAVAGVLPLGFALRSWLRGVLIARERPLLVQHAMVVHVLALVAVLGAGLGLAEVEGLVLGVTALTAALATELVTLTAWERGLRPEGEGRPGRRRPRRQWRPLTMARRW